MKDNRKTRPPSNRGNTASVSLFLVRDAGLNVRNRPKSHARVGRVERYSPEQRAKLGNALLQLGLAHHTGTAAVDWQITRSANGRPIVQKHLTTECDMQLSLSHSGEYLVAGICNAAIIGIDIERHCKRRFSDIARHLDWPQALWDPPGSLDAEGFYHAWTLWEAAIKSGSAESRPPAESVFKLLITGHDVGTPGAILKQNGFAYSWRCANHFWLSIITAHRKTPDIRLFLVNGLKSAGQSLQISEIASALGHLDPQIFQREQSIKKPMNIDNTRWPY